jgi:hypothetical protein
MFEISWSFILRSAEVVYLFSRLRCFDLIFNGLKKLNISKMKKANIKSRIKKDELNPVFHFKDKEEDDKVLTKEIIKKSKKNAKLELSGKNLKYGKLRNNQSIDTREVLKLISNYWQSISI